MSLRFVDHQILRTSPCSFLASASAASLSLWVHVAPGTEVMLAEGVVLFGDPLGRFAVTLLALGDIRVSWKLPGEGSSFAHKLVVGTNHHVASTWQDGEQRYYIDGQLVHADDQTGTLAIDDSGDSSPIRLGSDQAGVDVTLGEPAVWADHVLTPQEVTYLAARDVRVGTVAPGSIALRWSLAGPDGEAARVGDLGLTDASGHKLDLVSIEGSAPAYRGTVLTAAAAHVGSIQVAPSGRSVVVSMLDATGALAPIQSLLSSDDLQVLSLTGTAAGPSMSLSFGGNSTSAIPYSKGPPVTSWEFVASVAPGHYDFFASWPQVLMTNPGFANGGKRITHNAVYQILDGVTPLTSVVIDQNVAPSGYVDPNVSAPPAWQPLGSFAVTGNSVTIFISAPANGIDYLGVDAIRIAPTGGTDQSKVYYLNTGASTGPNVPANYAGVQHGPWTATYPGAADSYISSFVYHYTQAGGTANTVAIAATLIQPALSALPNVLANSVVVSAISSTSVLVHFEGLMSGSGQPTLVSSEPAMTVYHDGSNGSIVGGQYPSISINGGASIPLKYPIWGASRGDQHYIVYPLIQPSPSSSFLSAGVGLYSATDIYHWTIQYGHGYAGAGGIGYYQRSSPATATFPFQGLSAGTYQIAATWTAAAGNCPAAQFTVQDGSGNVLGTSIFDQTQVPADFNDAGAGWKTIGSFVTTGLTSAIQVVVSFGNPGGNLIVDTIRVDRTTAASSSILIAPTDSVTFSALPGFALTTAGAVPAQIAVPALNQAGGTLLPAFVAGAKTMKVGYNVEGEIYYGLQPVYANAAHRSQWPGTVNSDGYMVAHPNPNVSIPLFKLVPDSQGLGRGLPSIDAGTFVVMWDGPATTNLLLNPGSVTTSVTERTSMASITGTTNNTRIFDVGDSYDFSPSLALVASTTVPSSGVWSYTFSNLRIYPPGINPANPPLFHPSLIEKAKGASCLRFLDPLGTNASGVVEYSDFGSASNLAYSAAGHSAPATISSIAPDHATPRFYDANRGSVLITTTTPHGFPNGANVSLHGTIGTAHFTDGSTYLLDNDLGGPIHVTSPTTFLYAVFLGSGQAPTMTGTLTPSAATATMYGSNYYGGWIYFPDCIALCNQVNADLWVNVPALASDACVTAMATAIATGLKSGLKVHVEYSNECWNFEFPQYGYCSGMSSLAGFGDYGHFYVTQAVHVHNLFRAAFQANGRATNDVRRVLGTQSTSGGITSNLVTYLKAIGATFDELATAPYYNSDNVRGAEFILGATYDALTVDQVLDTLELNVQYGGLPLYMSVHRPILQAGGFGSVAMVTYEGGLSGIIPNGNGTSPNNNARTQGGMRHPRIYAMQLAFNQILQDAGCSLFNHFYLVGGFDIAYWSLYEGLNEPLGTGSATADAANITSPQNIPTLKSQRAGAIKAWQALVASASPIKPLRNGKPKARGATKV